mgnify:CR=1 FL=1
MVLTAGQTTAFFEHADQMGIPHATVIQLQAEGITMVDDLLELDKDMLKMIASNLSKPAGRVPNPGGAGTIPTPPFAFGARSQARLLDAANLVRFYDTIGRPVTAACLMYPVIANFKIQWKSLQDRKDVAVEVPKISKTLPVMKWSEAYRDWTHRQVGVQGIPLAYITRPDVTPVGALPAREADMPHSVRPAGEDASIERDLIERASHNHPSVRDDKAAVYHSLEVATRGTQYANTIQAGHRKKDGRACHASLLKQHTGRDKWERELKISNDFLQNRKWKGQSHHTLEKFIAQHRSHFEQMKQSAEYTQFQLPEEYTRVTYLLDNIECQDPELQAAMANCREDTRPTVGKMNNFEETASYLAPRCPVARNRIAKRNATEISELNAFSNEALKPKGKSKANVSSLKTASKKPAVGRTGVEFRYYKHNEFHKLTAEQKAELTAYRKENGIASSKGSGHQSKKHKVREEAKAISAAIVASFEEAEAKRKAVVEEDKTLKDYIMSVVHGKPKVKSNNISAAAASVTIAEPEVAAAPITLRSIMSRVKRGG